jgi:hypothetical protein
MLTPQIRQAVFIGAFAVLAVIALLGWTRDPKVQAGSPGYLTPQGLYVAQQVPQGPSLDYAGRQTYGPVFPAGQAGNGMGYAASPAVENCIEPEGVQNVAYAQPASTRYRTYNRPRVVRQVAYDDRQPERVVVERARKKRSTGKSVAIVAGSAGVGAAIGGLAGGGKGAGIGALTGGAAGFIYDRLTHNR